MIPTKVHLVGSIALDSVEDVFRTAGATRRVLRREECVGRGWTTILDTDPVVVYFQNGGAKKLTSERLLRCPPNIGRGGCRTDPPRTAVEIVQGLEATWRIIEDRLMRGSPADAHSDRDSEVLRTIWGLLDHNLPHAGRLSLLLRAIGMPGVDI